MESEKTKKKPGRVPQGNNRYNVILPEELAEWLKHQPGGMSETLRVLVRDAKEKQQHERN